ncbi:hypothetical protein VTN77DRAFT_9812 [Rasamsonia byssochlamydoides]|uniref:uncharacterized protein n=1 Tax=Rasamsonia byssochlamydoides TaxID=89139 RepID=UPI0037448A66
MSGGSSSPAASDTFSSVTKLEVRRIAQDQCWNCLATPIDVAHVVAKEDPAISLLSQRGMINFSLTSISNIALCPLCHRNFDQTLDPGFIFVPSDIAYFISFEEQDYEKKMPSCWRRDSDEDMSNERQVPRLPGESRVGMELLWLRSDVHSLPSEVFGSELYLQKFVMAFADYNTSIAESRPFDAVRQEI